MKYIVWDWLPSFQFLSYLVKGNSDILIWPYCSIVCRMVLFDNMEILCITDSHAHVYIPNSIYLCQSIQWVFNVLTVCFAIFVHHQEWMAVCHIIKYEAVITTSSLHNHHVLSSKLCPFQQFNFCLMLWSINIQDRNIKWPMFFNIKTCSSRYCLLWYSAKDIWTTAFNPNNCHNWTRRVLASGLHGF